VLPRSLQRLVWQRPVKLHTEQTAPTRANTLRRTVGLECDVDGQDQRVDDTRQWQIDNGEDHEGYEQKSGRVTRHISTEADQSVKIASRSGIGCSEMRATRENGRIRG